MPDGLMILMRCLWDFGRETGPWGERALLNNEPRNDLTSEGSSYDRTISTEKSMSPIWPLGRLIMFQDDISRVIKVHTYLYNHIWFNIYCEASSYACYTVPCDWVWKSPQGHFAGSLRGREGTEAELAPNRFTPKRDTLKTHKDARHP